MCVLMGLLYRWTCPRFSGAYLRLIVGSYLLALCYFCPLISGNIFLACGPSVLYERFYWLKMMPNLPCSSFLLLPFLVIVTTLGVPAARLLWLESLGVLQGRSVRVISVPKEPPLKFLSTKVGSGGRLLSPPLGHVITQCYMLCGHQVHCGTSTL